MSNPNTPIPMAQGFATEATPEEIAKEETYTNPNLHRRIDKSSDHNTNFYIKNSYDSMPSFHSNFYYDVNDGAFTLLESMPSDWIVGTGYNNYYHRYTETVLSETKTFIKNSYQIAPTFSLYNSFRRYTNGYEVFIVKPDDWDADFNNYYHTVDCSIGVFGTDSCRIIKTEYYNDDDPDKPEIP